MCVYIYIHDAKRIDLQSELPWLDHKYGRSNEKIGFGFLKNSYLKCDPNPHGDFSDQTDSSAKLCKSIHLSPRFCTWTIIKLKGGPLQS